MIGLASLMVTVKRGASIDSLHSSSYRKNNDFIYNDSNTLTSITDWDLLKLFERPSVCFGTPLSVGSDNCDYVMSLGHLFKNEKM